MRSQSEKNGDRSKHFPAIEQKYGEKISYWLNLLKEFEGVKYPEQVAFLRENFGFSQSHANAVVMYFRGSKSSRRYERPKDYFDSLNPVAAKTARKIFKEIQGKFPKLELVIAWNQPMVKLDSKYVFGLSVAKGHILLAPWSSEVLKEFTPRLLKRDFVVNKKTFAVPLDWKVDAPLLHGMIRAVISEQK
jgi:uncharacterized protein YdhG (YjbR/CyaY superfamily)